MSAPLTMYTTQWCAFCKRLKAQLARDGIEMTEVDIERDPAAADYVMSVNGGNQNHPHRRFPRRQRHGESLRNSGQKAYGGPAR